MKLEFIFKQSMFIQEEEKETKNVLNKIEKLRNSTSFMDSPIESNFLVIFLFPITFKTLRISSAWNYAKHRQINVNPEKFNMFSKIDKHK